MKVTAPPLQSRSLERGMYVEWKDNVRTRWGRVQLLSPRLSAVEEWNCMIHLVPTGELKQLKHEPLPPYHIPLRGA